MPWFIRNRDQRKFGQTREVGLSRDIRRELKNAGLLLRISNPNFVTQRVHLLRRTSQLNL